MSVENKVLERVKKMIALGNNEAATEGERENALRMAYNLLAKHNLSITDLPSDEGDEAREQHSVVISADKWARSLAQSVARLFFCKYFFQRSSTAGKDTHCFVGRQSNAITARHMSEFLIRSVKREATKRYQSPTSPHGRSFCVGTANSIHHRVTDMLRNDTESTPGTALVLVSLHQKEQEANMQWLEQGGVRITAAKSRADNSLRAGAYYSGKEFGKTVSLNQQVGATTSDTKRLQ